jgi:hypothetical protein
MVSPVFKVPMPGVAVVQFAFVFESALPVRWEPKVLVLGAATDDPVHCVVGIVIGEVMEVEVNAAAQTKSTILPEESRTMAPT